MGKKLLIVESPAKAKTIGKYLGGDFAVKSSVGHIRDLPKENSAIKIEANGPGKWTFTPKYVVSDGKGKVVSELKRAVKASDEIYLASDPDREGEAIAWHLKEVLAPVAGDKPFHRVTYNEITKPAVLKAVAEPRDIDMPRVDAQQARRILDRLVGYKVSPLLWKYIPCANNRTLSAGRVQSVALRLLVERQREIDAFVPETYHLMGVEAKKRGGGAKSSFVAKLVRMDGEKPDIREKQAADNILLDLAGAELEVTGLKKQPKVRHALPPFTTSTLQQAASSVLGFSPGKTMKYAQALYEQGRITYMRTDSVNVSDVARAAAKDYIISSCGAEFYPEKPNFFKSKADAQGAHEAIRPTDAALAPELSGLDSAALKLYDLIWRRFIASQMADARTTVKTVSIAARKPALAHDYLFTASATDVDFEGFLKIMKLSLKKKKAGDDEDDDDSDEVAALPQLAEGEMLDAVRWLADEKQTKGPSHYSEASLIKALEENGVGRPSTYAATIETLKTREYAKNEKKKLVPLERGILVCDWLVKKLDSLFNVGYTAEMEAELDKVEEKGEPMDAMLSEFYAKFLEALAACAEPAPDRSKFDVVFGLLDKVKAWKEPKTVGKRTYDDKAFVESVRRQCDENKPMSARQLEFLVRMVSMYSEQIPDAEQTLKEAGIGAGASMLPAKADEELVKFCFETMDRIGGMMKNPFLKSLREQVDRGRGLSPKQFSILARSVGENAGALPDCGEIRSKLAEFVPGGFSSQDDDPAVPGLLELMKTVTEWRPPAKKGKKIYDDRGFVDSLAEQYSRRHSLSPRQVMALRRVAVAYKDKIPGYAEHAERLGLTDIPSSREKSAEVLAGVEESVPGRRARGADA
ncbi:MAG: type I DNA topoisomerase [Kiritimatiellae bacterium]|nr:type I DNA topoisomerase [Kiritimatiellia bacterium]